MIQQSLFDRKTSLALKDKGMQQAADARVDELAYARAVARDIARYGDSTCDADQVQQVLAKYDIDLGNAAGSLFKTDEWVWTGQFRQSARVKNHGRLLRVWRLVR